MKNAKNSFERFLDDISRLYCSAYEETNDKKITITKGSVLKVLFGSNSENNSDNSHKINNENILFTSTYARNFLEKMIDFNNKNNDIDILEIPFPSKISYSEDFIKSFNIKLNQYYKNNIPYSWFSLPEFSDDNQRSFHQMILLSLKNSLKYRKYKSVKNEIKCFDKQMDSFYEYIANKDRIIFNGSFRSGKTTFLKSFVNVHFKEMYYFDSNYEDICFNDMFFALNPDLDFWNEEKTKNIVNNNTKICISGLLCDEFPKSFYEGKILIIDHVKDISVMKKFEELPCKLIFVVNIPKKLLQYEITYNFDNKDLCIEILNKLNKECSGDVIDRTVFDNLYSKLGKDILLYKCIETCQRNHKKNNLILDLCNVKQFDDYKIIFNKYNSKFSFSVNNQTNNKKSSNNKSKKLSSGVQLGKHIVQIYSNFFNDIQKKNDKTEILRDELQMLRLLCGLKNEKVSLPRLQKYLYDETLYNHLYQLNWINDKKIDIPSIVAYAFNRKELYIESYTYYLRFIEKVLDSFEYDKLFYVDCSTFHSFFKILINDYEEYVSDRNKSVNKIRIEHNVNNINLGYSTRIIKRIYETGIWFSFKYNDNSLYNFIIEKANKLDDSYEWKWFLSFWKQVQPVDREINRFKIVRPYLENKERMIENPHCIYFTNVYNIKLTNIDIINFFQKIFENDVLMTDKDCADLNELFKKMVNRFKYAYCNVNVFNILNTEKIKNILTNDLDNLKIYSKVLLCIHQFTANILSGKNFKNSLSTLLGKYNNICKNSTVLLQAYLILLCSIIFKHEEYGMNIQNLKKQFEKCCQLLGDLPKNINEIVNITSSYLKNIKA